MLQCPHCQLAMRVAPQMLGKPVQCPGCGKQFVAQASAFDPYYTWLGIPPHEQPANHYRLLGVPQLESNPAVIDNAADRQMRHLRSLRSGPHTADSERLLKEVAAARNCLLDPELKSQYDEQLRRAAVAISPAPHFQTAATFAPAGARTAARAGGTSALPGLPGESPDLASGAPRLPAFSPGRSPSRRAARRPSSAVHMILIVVGGLLGLALGVLVVFYLTGIDMLGWGEALRKRNQGQSLPAAETTPPPATAPAKSLPPQDIARNTPQPRPPADEAASKPPSTSVAPLQEETVPAAVADSPAAGNSAPATGSSADSPLPVGAGSWQLPALISTAPVPLPIAPQQAVDRLTINDEAADIPAKARIHAEADAYGGGWTIHYAADETKAASGGRHLATVRRESHQFTFAWAEPLDNPELRGQLANCLLEIGSGPNSQVVKLRAPTVERPFVLDLDKDKQTAEFDLTSLPASSKLRLQIDNLVDFGTGKIRGTTRSVPLGQNVVIEFDDLPGAQIKLVLIHPAKTNKLLFRAEPLFKETGSKEFELTRPSLERFRAAQERTSADAQGELNKLVGNLDALSNEQQRLRNNPPQNANEKAAWDIQMARSATTITTLQRRATRLRETIAECQQRLAAVPKVQSFIDALHGTAAIRYRISALAGTHEILLVDAR